MNVLRSEWTKLRSVRSTWIAVLGAVAACVALGVLGVSDQLGGSPADLPSDWDPTAESLKGYLFAQLVVGMLGVLSVTPEYASGMIGTSLTAVPSRPRLLGAKALVVVAIALVTGLVTTLVSFAVVQLLLGGADLPAAGIGDPGVARALVGGTLYLTLVALIGVAVGVLGRSTAVGLAVLVGALLLVPALAGILGDWFAQHWPITAGQAAYAVVPGADAVAPGLGLAILAATALGVGVAALVVLGRRDV
jgi:ABC-2 type transport system permease protein